MKKRNMKMIIAMVLLFIGFSFTVGIHVKAEPLINIRNTPLERLSGDGWYLNRVDFYYLDTQELNWKEEISNGIWETINNGLLSLICNIGQIAVVIFYYAMDFDIVSLFQHEISGIQKSLNNGVFIPLFTLAFCGAAIHVLRRMVQRDIMGAYGEIIKVVGIFVLSVFLVRDSAAVLSNTTSMTKAISVQVLVGIQNDGTDATQAAVTSYAAESAGLLWENLVHQPWLYLEFGNEASKVSDEFVGELFYAGNRPGTENRMNLINSYEGDAFIKERASSRFGFAFLYIPILIVKAVIYILMAVFMLAYQLFAIFYVFLAPIILLLAMIPGYEGIISAWLRKLIESQLGILILSFMLGVLIKIDELLYQKCAAQWGWFVVLVVQVVMEVVVIVKRDEILGMLGNLQRAGSASQYAKRMLRNSNTNAAARTKAGATKVADAGSRAVHVGAQAVRNTKSHVGKTRHYITTKYNERKNRIYAERENMTAEEPSMATERPVLDKKKVIRVENVDGRIEKVNREGAKATTAKVTQEKIEKSETMKRPRMDAVQK